MTMFFGGMAGELEGSTMPGRRSCCVHGLTFDREPRGGPRWLRSSALDPGRRTLALDLPGHGASPPRDSYSDGGDRRARAPRRSRRRGSSRRCWSDTRSAPWSRRSTRPSTRSAASLNVDQPLEVEPFARRSSARSQRRARRAAAFRQVWARFCGEHGDSTACRPLRRSCCERTSTPSSGARARLLGRPDRAPGRDVAEWARTGRATLRARRVPYEVVVGRNADAERAWFGRELPQAVGHGAAGRRPLPAARRSAGLRGAARRDERSAARSGGAVRVAPIVGRPFAAHSPRKGYAAPSAVVRDERTPVRDLRDVHALPVPREPDLQPELASDGSPSPERPSSAAGRLAHRCADRPRHGRSEL